MMGTSHDECMIELLRKRPGVAVELFSIALKENTPEELALILRQIFAAGYEVSVTLKSAQRKRAGAGAEKMIKRPSAGRGRTRRSAAAAIA